MEFAPFYHPRNRELLGDLSRAAQETVRVMMAEAGGDPGVRPGMVVVPQTFGSGASSRRSSRTSGRCRNKPRRRERALTLPASTSDVRRHAILNNRYAPVKIVDRLQEDGKNSAAVEALQKRFSVGSFPTVVAVS